MCAEFYVYGMRSAEISSVGDVVPQAFSYHLRPSESIRRQQYLISNLTLCNQMFMNAKQQTFAWLEHIAVILLDHTTVNVSSDS